MNAIPFDSRRLLEDPPQGAVLFETAAEHVAREVPVATPRETAGEVRRTLAGRRFESATHVAVCDGGRLVGVLRMEDLLAAPEDAPAASLMDPDPPVVAPGLDQEVAAWKAVQHRESALAVVESDGRFVGFLPPHRLLGVLLAEHDEDMARLGGFLRSTRKARLASEESVGHRFWHRLPWLLAGLLGAGAAADIVGFFEHALESQLLLAFFIPGIVYLADAVGTQTETLVVRGLSVGVRVGSMVRRELATGCLIGLALATFAYPVTWWRWGDGEVALVVALSLLAACSMATGVAMALPWLLHRLGRDPAFGSGPLGTVVQDLLSILVYFVIATWVVL
jgi:magnesium transporter